MIKKVEPEKASRTVKHFRKGTISDTDRLGDVHEYLIGQFAAGSKKKPVADVSTTGSTTRKKSQVSIRYFEVVSSRFSRTSTSSPTTAVAAQSPVPTPKSFRSNWNSDTIPATSMFSWKG